MNITIKNIYLFVVSALALTSCAEEDNPGLPESTDKQIVFRTSISPESRAQAVTVNNLSYFYMTAFDLADQDLLSAGVMQPLFANEKVEHVPGKDVYKSAYCCWPDQGKEDHLVSFFGFYPGPAEVSSAQLTNTSSSGAVSYKMEDFMVAADIAEQLDFITVYATGSMTDNLVGGVSLPFVHQLSRIEVKAHGENQSYDIEIAGVRIGGAGVQGTFEFQPIDGGGIWSGSPACGIVEYIYRSGERIVSCGKNNPVALESAVSIMGKKNKDGNDNCAMLIPATYTKWDHANDPQNADNKLYLSVLLRVEDATPTAGQNHEEVQRYPYKDLFYGDDALKIERVYFAVNKSTGVISSRLYSNGSGYFKDEGYTDPYTLPSDEEIKEFGWAALPVAGTWEAGYIYTYILDYTQGVGLHDPEVSTTAPGAGTPVISDKVGITYTVREWEMGGQDTYIVPGS